MAIRPPEPFYAQLGQRIADARSALHLSQAELGDKLEPRLTRASIANIENGKQRVLAYTLVQIAARLRVDLNELAGVSGDTPTARPDEVLAELQQKLPPGADVARLSRSLGMSLNPALPRRARS